MHGTIYDNRQEAGRRLAQELEHLADHGDVVVLGLPRGGVPVAFEVAKAIRAPLDVLVVRKLGAPGREELAMGAIAMGGVRVMNEDIVDWLGVSRDQVENVAERESRELLRRSRAYRGDIPLPELSGKTVVVVDDGLATGATMRAAVSALRTFDPATVIVAVPVGSPDVCDALEREADALVCPNRPVPFEAVGAWYRDFSQTPDREVRTLLEKAREMRDKEAAGP